MLNEIASVRPSHTVAVGPESFHGGAEKGRAEQSRGERHTEMEHRSHIVCLFMFAPMNDTTPRTPASTMAVEEGEGDAYLPG